MIFSFVIDFSTDYFTKYLNKTFKNPEEFHSSSGFLLLKKESKRKIRLFTEVELTSTKCIIKSIIVFTATPLTVVFFKF